MGGILAQFVKKLYIIKNVISNIIYPKNPEWTMDWHMGVDVVAIVDLDIINHN